LAYKKSVSLDIDFFVMPNKKSVIFAESPKIEGGQPQYYIYDYHSQLPPSLNNLREKYKDLRERSGYSTIISLRNYLINYLKGYTGKDVYSVNSNNTYSALDDDGYERVYSTEEFKDLPRLKKYNELEKEFYENYYPSLMALENEFRDHPDNTTSDRVSDVFQVEGNKLREWYKKKGEELSVIPIYGIQDTSKVNAALKDVDLQDVGIMGHSGEILGGIPLEWWNNKLKDAEYRNCILGSCLGDNLLPLLPDVKNIYHTIKNRWYGVNPSADSLENALFSTQEKTKIKPIKGKDYNISNKYKTGGNMSYTPEYIEQLKRFENRPDNLAYATGGQMRNATNSQFVPSYVNGVPVYGFGSWLGKNAGNLLQVAGGIGAMFVPGAQPLGISMIASGGSGIAGQALNDKNQKADEAEQRAEAEKQFMLNQYNDSQQYFTNGGMIPSMSRGGFMEGLKFYNDGGNLDNVTNFPVGGTHETNPRGGIPLGNNALVEEGEYVYNFPKQGKYVFSNRY
jgi:hypothetical protein